MPFMTSMGSYRLAHCSGQLFLKWERYRQIKPLRRIGACRPVEQHLATLWSILQRVTFARVIRTLHAPCVI